MTDVVVELEVPDAVAFHQMADHSVHALPNSPVPVVELIPAPFDHSLAVTLEEGLCGQLLGDDAAYPNYLRFDPENRGEPRSLIL